MNMAPIHYGSTKKKRQTPKSLALEAIAPPDLTSNIVAECQPVVKPARGRPRKAPEDKAGPVMGFRVKKERREAYDRAATAANKTLTAWALDTLDRAAIRCEVCSGILSDHVGGVPCNLRKPGADE